MLKLTDETPIPRVVAEMTLEEKGVRDRIAWSDRVRRLRQRIRGV